MANDAKGVDGVDGEGVEKPRHRRRVVVVGGIQVGKSQNFVSIRLMQQARVELGAVTVILQRGPMLREQRGAGFRQQDVKLGNAGVLRAPETTGHQIQRCILILPGFLGIAGDE